MEIQCTADFRIRTDTDPVEGDYVVGPDGAWMVIYKIFVGDGKRYSLLCPSVLIDRDEYMSAYFDGRVPLASPEINGLTRRTVDLKRFREFLDKYEE